MGDGVAIAVGLLLRVATGVFVYESGRQELVGELVSDGVLELVPEFVLDTVPAGVTDEALEGVLVTDTAAVPVSVPVTVPLALGAIATPFICTPPYPNEDHRPALVIVYASVDAPENTAPGYDAVFTYPTNIEFAIPENISAFVAPAFTVNPGDSEYV